MRNLLHSLETFIITTRSFSVRKERMILARCLVKTLTSSLERMSSSWPRSLSLTSLSSLWSPLNQQTKYKYFLFWIWVLNLRTLYVYATYFGLKLVFFKNRIKLTVFNFPNKSFLSTFLKYFYQIFIWLRSQSIPGQTRFITSRYLEIIDCCRRW